MEGTLGLEKKKKANAIRKKNLVSENTFLGFFFLFVWWGGGGGFGFFFLGVGLGGFVGYGGLFFFFPAAHKHPKKEVAETTLSGAGGEGAPIEKVISKKKKKKL